VTSHDAGQAVFASGFDSLRLYPGDSVIVPEKSVHPRTIREMMDWTQMVSQFAMGTAAVDVMR
jgi:hypothetical protein